MEAGLVYTGLTLEPEVACWTPDTFPITPTVHEGLSANVSLAQSQGMKLLETCVRLHRLADCSPETLTAREWPLLAASATVAAPLPLRFTQPRAVPGPVARLPRPVLNDIPCLPRFSTRSHAWDSPFRALSVSHPVKVRGQKPVISRWSVERLSALPLARQPIPVYRLSTATRQAIRAALADAARVAPEQIRIHRVYDRMRVGLFRSLSMDERGVLWCFPRPDATLLPGMSLAYLAFGGQHGENATLRVLVPMEEINGDTPDV
jgi:hypothetical protein